MALRTSSPTGPETRANFFHLYADIAWYGLLAGSTLAFLAVYATRLGASGFQIGLLSAGPALVNMLFSLPSGHWLEGRQMVRTVFQMSLIHRAGFLLIIPLPWLFSYMGQIWAVVLVTLLMSAAGTVLSIAFNAMFADMVSPDRRAEVVGVRNALIAVTVTLTSLLSGYIFEKVAFPTSYQIVFSLGAFGAYMSSYHLSRLKNPTEPAVRVAKPMGDQASPGALRQPGGLRNPGLRFLTRSGGRPLLRLDLLRGAFGPFLFAYLVFYMFQYLPLPLFPLFYVRDLNLPDSIISIGTAFFHVTMMLLSLRLSRLSNRFGHRKVLVWSAALFGGYPLILYFARGAGLYWAASIYGGVVIGLLGGALVNRLMERVPEDDRPAHMALHNLALNLGILAGSLAGPLLGDWLGLRDAILASAFLRVAAALLLIVWG